MKNKLLMFIFMYFAASILLAQTPEKRLALVIGNANYSDVAVGSLRNSVNDANLMEATLKELGFEVIKKTDANLRTMEWAITEFSNKILEYDVALFYYAGHGAYIDGVNYLFPVDINSNSDEMIKYKAFDVKFIVDAFTRNQKNVNIMILDACRNNPLPSFGYANSSSGYRTISNQPVGSIIAFATREGETADGGSNHNSINGLYTEYLAEQLKIEQNITEVFQNTRRKVVEASGNKQFPQECNMLIENLILAKNDLGITLPQPHRTFATGNLLLKSEISGDLYLDNQFLGRVQAQSEYQINEIKVGNYVLEVRELDVKIWMQNIEIVESDVTEIKIPRFINPISGTTDATQNILTENTEIEITNQINGMVFRRIEGGTFTMGKKDQNFDERPIHKVTISTFYMGKCEVTRAQWDAIMGTNQSAGCANCPKDNVSWDEVQVFIQKLNSITGQTYRLPTEAEWEYAAGYNFQMVRGDTVVGAPYYWAGTNSDSEMEKYVWYSGNSSSRVHEVGQKLPNSLGLFDMSGNVWEWCSDWYGAYYEDPQINPTGAEAGLEKVLRGGSVLGDSNNCSVFYRGHSLPSYKRFGYGFRLVLVR